MAKTETKFKQKLEELNMTSAQVAAELHIAPSTVTGWIKGEREIYPALIGQVCGVLACTEEEIIGKVEKKTMAKKKTTETEAVNEQLILDVAVKETATPSTTVENKAKEDAPVKEEKQSKKAQKAKAEAKTIAEVPAKVKKSDKVVVTKPGKTATGKKATKQIGDLPGDIEWLMTHFDFREKAKAIKTKDDIDEWCGAFSEHIDYLMEGLTSVAFGYIDSVTETNPRINKLLSLAEEASDTDLDMAISLLERLNASR